jgi:hypothetical protein
MFNNLHVLNLSKLYNKTQLGNNKEQMNLIVNIMSTNMDHQIFIHTVLNRIKQII